MREISHVAIDAGADLVEGRGPRYSLAIEAYHGKAIFHGLGRFSFRTCHCSRRYRDWIGTMARAAVSNRSISGVSFQFVRHNGANETVPPGNAAYFEL